MTRRNESPETAVDRGGEHRRGGSAALDVEERSSQCPKGARIVDKQHGRTCARNAYDGRSIRRRIRANPRVGDATALVILGLSIGSARCANRGGHPVGGGGSGLVLPDAHDGPASLDERAINQTVSRNVALELRLPVLRVGPGVGRVLGAPMPEAPVDEDRDPGAREYDIGPHAPSREIDAKVLAEA